MKIKIDIERLNKSVTVDDWIEAEEGKIKGIRNVVSHFIVGDNGAYLSRDKALKEIGSLNLEDLGKLGADFIKAAEEAASGGPKAQTESTAPISQD